MKLIVSLSVAILFCYSISAQDFRKVSWGDSKAVVKASESVDQWEEYSDGIYDALAFETSIIGLETIVVFVFVGDKLVRTGYIFAETHMNNNLYIDEFDRVDELLKSKYGEGEKDEIWNNELFKRDQSSHGDAISYGHYEVHRYWEVPGKTSITHSLAAGDNDIQHEVRYSSIELEDFVTEAEAEVF